MQGLQIGDHCWGSATKPAVKQALHQIEIEDILVASSLSKLSNEKNATHFL
jgi:hypothetical protein